MRLLIDLLENNELEEGRILIHESLRRIVTEKFKGISSTIMSEEAGGAEATDPDDVVGTIEDPLITQGFDREYFFKRFKHGEKYEIILKKLGLGQNAPTVSYINDTRYEVFTTSQQAEKETIRYIEDGSFDAAQKQKEEKKKEAEAQQQEQEPAPATEEEPKNESVEVLRGILESQRPDVIDFDNGESRVITLEEAENALEIYDLLNNTNKIKFIEKLRSGETVYLEMLDFLMDRIRKGII